MKRLLAVFLFALACYPTFAGAKEQTDPQRPNRWRLEYRDKTGVSTEAVSVDADGNFLPGDNYQTSIGESSHSWKKVWTGSLSVSSGIVNIVENFPNLLSSSSDVSKTAGGLFISTAALEQPTTNNMVMQATSYITTDINQSTITPRTLLLYSTVTASGASGASTTTLVGCATFYGIDNLGKSNWEMIFFSTTIPQQKGGIAVSTNMGVGNVAWASISSFTVQLTSVTQAAGMFDVTGVRLVIGWGNKIGLSNTIDASTDIYMTFNPVVVDTTNETVYFTLPPDGSRNYVVRYKARTSTP